MLHQIATHRDALKAVVNKIIDETSVDDLLSMLQEIANDRANQALETQNISSMAQWLMLDRALKRAVQASVIL